MTMTPVFNSDMTVSTYYVRELSKVQIIPINIYFKCQWTKRSNQKTRVTDWIKKQDPSVCYLQVIHFRTKDTQRLKGRGWKSIKLEMKKEKSQRTLQKYKGL